MPRDCPVCGLVNPDTAPACDCGYSFLHAGTVGRVQLAAVARRNMLVGGFLCLAGLLVTLLTLAVSGVTGFSVVAWGAIVFGALQFIRGVMQRARQQRSWANERIAEQDAPSERPSD